MRIGYWWECRKERDHSGDQGIVGWIILKWILREIGWDGMDWIDLGQDKNQWRALANRVNEPSGSLKCWEVLEWLHNW
jgi:hypothetical protein